MPHTTDALPEESAAFDPKLEDTDLAELFVRDIRYLFLVHIAYT